MPKVVIGEDLGDEVEREDAVFGEALAQKICDGPVEEYYQKEQGDEEQQALTPGPSPVATGEGWGGVRAVASKESHTLPSCDDEPGPLIEPAVVVLRD
uniref:Uncharacterized protein n=2 Tax=Candidatus Bipolaricaulota TaxID=67810 RepID=H5SF86_9BACT|nr:hypothetical protein HGMM_F21A08C05 [uncultured Acetothermia bacterium]BAL58598.1 hypothetical protein HGMM_OP2C148 [Candidatus Acetothermum autotrophicum]